MSAFYVVVPAGGSGTRLWPLSRAAAPKFLHPFGSDPRSLLQVTVDRLRPLASADSTYIVCGPAHAASISAQLPDLRADHVLVEPGPRNSAPAIGLAAGIIAARDPDAVMGSFAADHLIGATEAFLDAVRTAIAVARTGRLVTIGLRPTRPETGYGYIRTGPTLALQPAREVLSFKEKPSLDVATAYVASGDFLWNAGMFVWPVAMILDQLEDRVPGIGAPLRRVGRLWSHDRDAAQGLLRSIWPELQSISIDHAVLEPAAADGLVATVPADLDWSDVGDWNTYAELQEQIEQSSDVLLIDSDRSAVLTETGKPVTLIGVPDVVVVETADAVLVVARDQAQRVREAVDAWRDRGRSDLL